MKIIAHRGNDGIHRENSKEAILNSLLETDGAEFDIRMTRDLKFIINHNPFYKGYYIKNTTLKKLKKLGLNSLEEILSNINNNKIILIEIKEESNKFNVLIRKLYKILKKYPLNYYVFSFNYKLMKSLKRKHPDLKCGLLIGIKVNVDKINNDLDFNGVNYIHAKKSNKESFIWTINNKEELKYIDKTKHIITDRYKYISKYIS